MVENRQKLNKIDKKIYKIDKRLDKFDKGTATITVQH